MSTPCTTCGEPLADDAIRCPTCGALASPRTDETRIEQTGSEDAPPWSIPIREPAVASQDHRSGSRRGVALVALAVAAFVLTVVLGSQLLGADDPGTTSRGAGADDVAGPEPAGIDAASVTTETTTTTAPTITQTSAPEPTTTSAPPTTAAPSTTVAARTAPNGTGSVPALSTSFRGWIAQLESVPYAAGTDGLADEWERTRVAAPGAVALRSDDWSGLGDGFWVLLDPGPFSSAEDVRSFCSSVGLDDDGACLARELRG